MYFSTKIQFNSVQFLVFVWQKNLGKSAVLAKQTRRKIISTQLICFLPNDWKQQIFVTPLTIDKSTNYFHSGMFHYSKKDNHKKTVLFWITVYIIDIFRYFPTTMYVHIYDRGGTLW